MGAPTEGLAEARRLFAAEGLPFPSIPPALAPAFRRLEADLYGTRDGAVGFAALPRLLAELGAGPVDDYLLLGKSGRGMQSNVVCYYLVLGPLALFVEAAWGNAYGERAAEAAAAGRLFADAADLAAVAAEARAAGRLAPDERVVVLSSAEGCRWRRLTPPEAAEAMLLANAWREERRGLPAIMAALSG